jgi:mannosyl-oligosaccharide alpha-1,2-mannosidase
MLLQQEAGHNIHDSITGIRKTINLGSNTNSTSKHFIRVPQITNGPKEKPHLVKKKKQNLRVENFKLFVPQGGRRYVEFINGTNPREITEEMREESDNVARERREYVKKAMKHAWSGYKKYAFGADELLPLSKEAGGYWGGLGVTLVDSLDTLWLMGLKDEFREARDWVQHKLSFDDVAAVSVFETTIRSLGGLLSAYDWSGDRIFLEKANDLGTRLLNAFESPNGLPYEQTELNSHNSFNAPWQGNQVKIAEIGTLQLEFRYLSHVTGNHVFAEKVNHVFDCLAENQPDNGLYPLYAQNDVPEVRLQMDSKSTLGGMGDSFYEYMLKTWLQGGKVEDKYRKMFDKAMDGAHENLVQKSVPDGLTYVADLFNGNLDRKMDHLACFMGGLWALGAYTNPDGFQSPKAQRDLVNAKAITYTCYQMYARFPTGLAPEIARFDGNPEDKDFSPQVSTYLLRPETVESLFILNFLTGDPVYREWGWEIFQAIERFCRTDEGFSQISNVEDIDGQPINKMESFFLAETLKYLYLLFDPDTKVDILNEHVFNTEAHPLRRLDRLEQNFAASKF